MMIIYEMFITIYIIIVLLLTFILSAPILACIYPFVDQKTFAWLNEVMGGTIIMKAMTLPGFWTLKITDLRKDKTFEKQYIIIANHCSFIDTLLIWQLPLYKKFMMAEKFIQIPIFGWLCQKCGHVFVDRFKKSTTEVALSKSIKAMKDGSSFVMFPEGRRSEDPYSLLPFKTGAFRLAQQTGCPILPVIIKGSGKAMPVGSICHLADIELVIGEPINIEADYENIKSHPAIKESREFILEELKKSNKNKIL